MRMSMSCRPLLRCEARPKAEPLFQRIEISLQEALDRKATFCHFSRIPGDVEELERLKEEYRIESTGGGKFRGICKAAPGMVAVWRISSLEVAPGWEGEGNEFSTNSQTKQRADEHWHNVYVAETVSEAVDALRSCGIKVDFTQTPEDQEDANGYIENVGGVISSCVRWRRKKNGDAEFVSKIPQRAMSCLQLLSSAGNFKDSCVATRQRLTIIQDCLYCEE